jgi:hypothetical protein
MQSAAAAPFEFQVRPPWNDEWLRVREFIPGAFESGSPAHVVIAVQGPLERIVAGAAILRPTKLARPSALVWRIAGKRYRTRKLLLGLFGEAARLHREDEPRSRLRLNVMIDENSEEAGALRELGFSVEAAHDVYEISAPALWERIEPLHRRLTSRGLIPPNCKLAHLTQERLGEAGNLMSRFLPNDDSPFAETSEGFRMEHSYVLLVDDVVKGLLLCRNSGEVSHIGAVLVMRDLQGGYGWANFVLHYESLREGIEYGVKTLRFTADPALHPNTVGFAVSWGAIRVGAKVRFFLD